MKTFKDNMKEDKSYLLKTSQDGLNTHTRKKASNTTSMSTAMNRISEKNR